MVYGLFCVGSTYAYFAFQEENESVITGNVIAIDVDLDVQLVVGTNAKMVPMQDAALSNAINGVGSTNGACVDNVGNLSCQVYKITLTNNGSRIQHVNGIIELYSKDGSSNVYNNLKWRELSNTTTIKTNSVINDMAKSMLVSDLTMESKEVRIWYIAVWISEVDYDQKEMDKGLFGGTVTFGTESVANPPNLDSGNLIPVYYDDTVTASDGTLGVWKKADRTNADNSWYNYNNKMWANAVMISDSTKRTAYQSATVGTPIADSDITAFYVWIPRYKYRVWNISRQGGAESTYAYSAYSNGIQIKFESGTVSTGNVTCSYDDQTTESATYLADNCSVNGTEVSYNTSNLVYGEANQAWYTHPAFNFGDDPKTGFWIGKFETTGTESNPTVLPDEQSLRYQTVSMEFMSAKKFQNYLSNSTLDAHMLTNLEWGAVAYLTHSIYGLCDESTCSGMNNNNSSSYYTGRSSGAIADGTYNTYGTYNYKGYILNDNNPTTSKDITKVASTTKNITGVYDLTGGAYDYVMGNMVSSSKVFYSSSAGSSWNGTEWYDSANNKLYSKYYNSYAYGTHIDGAIAFNRARLGDATAEVLGGTTNASSWKPGSGITASRSYFTYYQLVWFSRGGIYNNSESGFFYFSRNSGPADGDHTFRSSLS